MKIRNIVFSGFMASILMVGGAYAADADALTNKGYVDAGLKWAKNAAISAAADNTTTKVDALANGTVKENTDAIAAINNTSTGILAQAKADATTKANAAQAAAESTASTALTNKVGAIGDGTVKDYVDTAKSNAISTAQSYTDTVASNLSSTAADLSALTGRVTTAENDIDALETKVGGKSVADQISDHNTSNAAHNDIRTAISNNAAAISDEVTRAGDAEGALADRLDIIEGADTVAGSIKKALADAEAYADGLASNYATSAQGALADTAVQPEDLSDVATAKCGSKAGDLCYVNGEGGLTAIKVAGESDWPSGGLL